MTLSIFHQFFIIVDIVVFYRLYVLLTFSLSSSSSSHYGCEGFSTTTRNKLSSSSSPNTKTRTISSDSRLQSSISRRYRQPVYCSRTEAPTKTSFLFSLSNNSSENSNENEKFGFIFCIIIVFFFQDFQEEQKQEDSFLLFYVHYFHVR